MASQSMKNDTVVIDQILYYCERIEYNISTIDGDVKNFLDNEMIQESCSFALIQIGEQVKRLSVDFTSVHNEIEWKKIAGLRNVIAHRYGEIIIDELWKIITNNVPALRESLLKIRKE